MWSKIDYYPSEMDFIAICPQGLDFLEDVSVIIMENENFAILFHVFVCKTKYSYT